MLEMELYKIIRNLGIASESVLNENVVNSLIQYPGQKDSILSNRVNFINSGYTPTDPAYAVPISWTAENAYSSDHGLQFVVFKNTSTHQIVIYSIGQQATGVESQRDQDYTSQPVLHDQVPVTVFELVQQYELIKNDPANQNFDIILAGHSGGAVDSKIAGAILQYQGEDIEVASYSGWGERSILNNLYPGINQINTQLKEENFANFYNSGDALILQRAGAVDDFGFQFYAPPTDVVNLPGALLGNENHALNNLDFSSLTPFWNIMSPLININGAMAAWILAWQALNANLIAGSDVLGAIGTNTVEGTSNDDVLVGTRDSVGVQYNDSIYGHGGNDILFGDKGNDTLIGGVGNDTYYGSTGNDTFLVRQEEGLDVIRNTFSDDDTLQFTGLSGTTFNRGDVQSISAIGGIVAGQSLGDLLITFDDNNKVLIENQFDSSKPHSGIENIKFDDGYIDVGTFQSETYTGSSGDDVAYSLDGDDVLEGKGGNDTLYGGDGNDTYHFAIGDGHDVIDDSDRIGEVRFGEGFFEYQLHREQTAEGWQFTFDGHPDDSITFIGSPLSYRFADDKFFNVVDTPWMQGPQPHFDGTAGNDMIFAQSNEGENAPFIDGGLGDDIVYGSTANDHILISPAAFLSIHSEDWIHYRKFYEHYDTFDGNDTYYGGDGDDIIASGSYDLATSGAATWGGEGSNTGLDVAYGEAGNDVIKGVSSAYGGSGNDHIEGRYVVKDVEGVNPTGDPEDPRRFSSTRGSNSSNYNDYLEGGIGDDVLVGLGGNDTYFYNLGDGNDTIQEGAKIFEGDSVNEIATSRNDRVVFGEGIEPADLEVSISGLDLIIQIGTGSIRIEGQLNPENNFNRRVEYFQFSDEDETVISFTELLSQLGTNSPNVNGTEDPDYLYGTSTNQSVSGAGGDDYIQLSSLGDIAEGGDGNDTIDAGSGNDTLLGNDGNDFFIVNTSDVTVIENANEGFDTVLSKVSYTLTDYVEALTLVEGNIDGTGNDLDNTITGTDGNNILISGLGFDTLYGEAGNDSLDAGANGDYLEGGDGNDTLAGGTGNDSLMGGKDDDRYIFNLGDGEDFIYEENGNDTLKLNGILQSDVTFNRNGSLEIVVDGTSDIIIIGDFFTDSNYEIENFEFGDNSTLTRDQVISLIQTSPSSSSETILGLTTNDTIDGLGGSDSIYGYAGNDSLTGGASDDSVVGGQGNDTLRGGAGFDFLNGEEGDDLYVFNSGDGEDTILENKIDGGNDRLKLNGILQANVTFTIDPNNRNDLLIIVNGTNDVVRISNMLSSVTPGSWIETVEFGDNSTLTRNQILSQLQIEGTEGSDSLTGSSFAESIYGGAGDDFLDGKEGADTLIGGEGDDTLGDTLSTGGNTTYEFDGNWGNDTINDQAGIDTLNLSTISSNLTVNLSNTSNQVTDGTNMVTWDSVSVIENAQGGSGNDVITGNDSNNTLVGNGANDTINGGVGNDSLIGGTGNDTFIVDSTGDVVSENLNEGTDLVQANISYTLGNNVENLTLTGNSNINGIGNDLDNVITGNNRNNVLNGGTGTDTLIGGLGNDTYVVDNSSDVINEGADVGIDSVQSSVSYILGANLENLSLTGTSAIDGTGNTLDNVLIGNGGINTLTGLAGNDTLDGGAGADSLIGGTGDDTYVVDNTGDVIVEALDEDYDTVQSSVSYTLSSNVENLFLTGTDAVNGTGNTLDNILVGNSAANSLNGADGADILDGGEGTDTLIGGLGDDIYIVDNVGDVITEQANEGSDIVYSLVSYALGNNVEDLILFGSDDLTATGNSLDNFLSGTDGNNTLDGSAGDDTLEGDAGDDAYIGLLSGSDLIGDTSGSSDSADFTGHTTTQDELVWTAVDTNNDTFVDSLLIDLENGSSVQINNYFDNTSVNDDTSGAGTGAIEHLVFDNDSDVTFSDVINLIQPFTNDTLNGAVGADTLDGVAGNDLLNGNAGNDLLKGGAGNDVLNGGIGNDSLDGGSGNDVYVFVPQDGQDTITDVSGADTFDFSSYVTGITVNLNNASVSLPFSASTSKSLLPFSGSDGSTAMTDVYGNAWAAFGNAQVASSNPWKSGEKHARLDGIGDYIRSTTMTPTGSNWTIHWRQRFDSIGTYNPLVYSNNAQSFSVWLYDGVAKLTLSSNGTSANIANVGGTETDWATGQWYDFELSYSSTDGYRLYVDGNLEVSVANTTAIAAAGGIRFGAKADNAYYTNGAVTDIYFTNSETLHTSNFTPSTESYLSQLQSSVTWNSNAIENVIGGNGNDTLIGTTADNKLTGGAGNDTLTGDAGNDIYVFASGFGTDSIIDASGSDTFDFSAFTSNLAINLTGTNFTESTGNVVNWSSNTIENLMTGSGNDNLLGNASNNTFTAGLGNDTLTGGSGNDSLLGGDGNDSYIFASGFGTDTINDSNGTDTLDLSAYTTSLSVNLSTTSLTEGSNSLSWGASTIENLKGGSGSDNLTGTSGDNLLAGGFGNDSLNGGDGNDTYVFAPSSGQSTIIDSSGNDTLDASAFSSGLTINLSTSSAVLPSAATTSKSLFSLNSSADGSISITDIYGNAWTAFGNAQVASSSPWKSGEKHVRLDGTGDYVRTTAVSPTGSNWTIHWRQEFSAINTYNPLVYSNNAQSFAVWLYNGVPLISLSSNGVANSIGSASGTKTDWATGQWYDFELSYSSTDGYRLFVNGNLEISISNTTPIYASGGIRFGAKYDGSFYTNGSVADVYFTNSETLHTSNFTPSTDSYISQLQSSATWNSNAIENVIGGNGNDILTGNNANNVLTGGAGTDSLLGGSGNDIYIVDSTTDVITENAGEGTDTIQSSVTYMLSTTQELENLTLTGTSAINGTGNTLNNYLLGTSGANSLTGGNGNDTLDGGAGNDTLVGGAGDDLYIIDSTSDVMNETVAGSAGMDTVQSSVTWTLGTNLENLTLSGSSNINGTGNTLDNVLTGNMGANSLTGAAGADTLNSGTGNDFLSGSTGNDVYSFAKGDGQDVVIENDTTVGNSDKLSFGASVGQSTVAIFKTGSGDLQIGYTDSSGDLITVQDFDTAAGIVERFELSNGYYMTDADINQIISDMAAYASTNSVSFTSLSDVENNAALMAIVNGGWHS